MSLEVIRVSPERIRYKLEDVSDLQAPVWSGDWDLTRRWPMESTIKYRSIAQHFRDGVPWLETDIFRQSYTDRFARGEVVHGRKSLEELADQYDVRQAELFEDLRKNGFVGRVDGVVQAPDVYLGRDGELFLGNDGNHRISMAKLLGLPSVQVRIRTRHPEASLDGFERVKIEPELHEGANDIPAMTTPAERYAGYLLAKTAKGAVIELGAWLGAMTVYLAAGVRDGGGTLHTYDRFAWKPVHTKKAGELTRPMREQFELNLGPLLEHVKIHSGDFRTSVWSGEPIGLMMLDGPKRVKELTRTIPIFGPSLMPGARLAWQDFAHFSCYDLPASLDTLERAGVVKWEGGVYPGTMGIFEVLRPITAGDVSDSQLRLDRWTPETIEATWERWVDRLPSKQVPRFLCGAVFFLHDLGHVNLATSRFRALVKDHRDDIAKKWKMIRETNPDFLRRYPKLDAEMGPC